VFECVIQQLTANQVQGTPSPPTGLFRNCTLSERTSGVFGTRGCAEPTPGPSGSCGCSVKSSYLPTYQGKRTLYDVTAFLFAQERDFNNVAQAIRWVGTTGWGEQAVLQQKGDAAVWAMHRFPMSKPIKWSTFCEELKAKYIPSNALNLVKRECEELSLKSGERVTEFNKRFRQPCSKRDLHQPMPAQKLADTYGFKIEKGNQGVYKALVRYIGMHNRTPTLDTHMEHLTTLDKSLN